MKVVGLVTILVTVPFTHRVCPTSASVMDNTSRQPDAVALAVGGGGVGESKAASTAVRVGRIVGLGEGVDVGSGVGVGVRVGGGRVFVGGKLVGLTSRVGVLVR